MSMETTVPSKAIAEAALELLNGPGEFAMLPFLMGHAVPTDDGSEWLEDGRLVLMDGSRVEHAKGVYRFLWSDAAGNEVRKLKASTMPDDGRPEPPSAPRVLLNWPTITDVLERVDEFIEARTKIDPSEPLLTFAEMCRIAPSLYWAIQRANAQARFPETVFKYLDISIAAIAETALDELPEEEMGRLKTAYIEAAAGQSA